MKIGVSSYSFSQLLSKNKISLIDTVKLAAEIGFDSIEFTQLPDSDMPKEELAKLLVLEAEKYNIEISAYLIGANLLQNTEEEMVFEVERIKKELDIAKILGVKLFRFDILFSMPKFMSYKMAIKKVVPYIREIADYGKNLGITTMTENHGQIFQDADRMIELYSEVDNDNFKLLCDMGNFMCADEVCQISVSKVISLTAHIHSKDFLKFSREEAVGKPNTFTSRAHNYLQGTVVGKGEVNVSQCLSIIKSSGYDGFINIEYEGPNDCIDALKEGLSYLRENI